MRTPKDIYARYDIMRNLQLHQLRVAAVGKMVCDNFSSEGGSAFGGQKPVNTNDVILACLFHDMGNIVKFELTTFPQFLEPQGIAHWQQVKAEFEKKYGTDQHGANAAIAREIGLSEKIIGCIDAVAFSRSEAILASGSWEQRICEYSDSRVAPHGVVSLEERLREARERYLKREHKIDIADVPKDRFEDLVEVEREMERRIFANAKIKPENITDASAAPIIEQLWEYPVG